MTVPGVRSGTTAWGPVRVRCQCARPVRLGTVLFMSVRLLAFDGSFILYRSFHALRDSGLSNAAGEPVWALHGALRTICQLTVKLRPTHVVVALDAPGGCRFRQAELDGYKHGRATPPPELLSQLRQWPLLLADAGVASAAQAGWEADDMLASLACEAAGRGGSSVLCSGDRDLFQLVDMSTTVIFPDGTTVDEVYVATKYGVSPSQYRELAALRGEPSDNIPGVAGVGDKTARKLLSAVGSIVDAPPVDVLEAAVGVNMAARLVAGRAVFERNMRVNGLVRDLVVADAFDAGRLPIDASRAASACASQGLRQAAVSLPASLGSVWPQKAVSRRV